MAPSSTSACSCWPPTCWGRVQPHGRTARGYAEGLPYEVAGMFRSRANTIEGGTSEVNRNIVGERVLGLPPRARPLARSTVAGGA